MKPFDLERAKAGDPVYDTVLSEIAHFVGVGINSELVIEARGAVCKRWEDELRMAPKKRTVWVNLYENQNYFSIAYYTEEEADADKWDFPKRLGGKAHPIVIEE
jgi:hypothetical protein